MQVGDLVNVVFEPTVGIITKVVFSEISDRSNYTYYVLVNGHNHTGPVPFSGSQLKVISESS